MKKFNLLVKKKKKKVFGDDFLEVDCHVKGYMHFKCLKDLAKLLSESLCQFIFPPVERLFPNSLIVINKSFLIP